MKQMLHGKVIKTFPIQWITLEIKWFLKESINFIGRVYHSSETSADIRYNTIQSFVIVVVRKPEHKSKHRNKST